MSFEKQDIRSNDDCGELAEWPVMSVVVPIRNEEPYIEQTITYIREQDYPADKVEILVVDGESDDRTVEIVRGLAAGDDRIKLHNNPKRLSSAARNVGAKQATGDIVLYIDGHVYIDNRCLLKNVARLMYEKDVSVLSRPGFQNIPGISYYQQAVALARRSAFGHGLGSTGFTEASRYCAPESTGTYYRREAIGAVGYFDEEFDAAEDFEFNYRLGKAGYKSFTAPELIVYYYPRDTIGKLFHQMKRYGIGRCRLVRKHPEAFSLAAIIPAAFVAGLPALLLLSLAVPQALWLAVGLYGFYAVLNILVSIATAARKGWKFLPVLPFTFAAIHIGVGWGLIGETARQVSRKISGK
ncbi:MAG: glycosyltransferase family 2 protein [candidate division Zixibacteria bacterium]|nr:glycosyltransferase family 2 protein [candidate division Zixibacteria bacterium]